MKTATPKRFLWIGFAGACCVALGMGFITRPWSRPASALAERPARMVRIFFNGALTCEGREGKIPISAWRVNCLSQELVMAATSPPSVELPVPSGSKPLRLSILVPGWSAAVVSLPPAAENGFYYIQEPIVISRKKVSLDGVMPPLGTDYDFAEVRWVQPLDEEPLAPPPGESAPISLDFTGTKRLASLPTGVYRCVLKGRNGGRVRDFVLNSALALRPVRNPAPAAEVWLPPSLSRTYVGFAGSAANPQQAGSFTGFFCGIDFDLRKNTGNLVLVSRPLQKSQTLRYADLKPRPDTMWPISNLFLEDPVSLAFDCPLSYVDHRIVLHAADGHSTLLPEMILPEDDRQRRDLLSRMQSLIRVQARTAAEKSGFFDSHYVRLPAQQLPNYENLESPDQFSRHLGRLSRMPPKPIELGSQITVHQTAQSSWEVHIDSIFGEPAHP